MGKTYKDSKFGKVEKPKAKGSQKGQKVKLKTQRQDYDLDS